MTESHIWVLSPFPTIVQPISSFDLCLHNLRVETRNATCILMPTGLPCCGHSQGEMVHSQRWPLALLCLLLDLVLTQGPLRLGSFQHLWAAPSNIYPLLTSHRAALLPHSDPLVGFIVLRGSSFPFSPLQVQSSRRQGLCIFVYS